MNKSKQYSGQFLLLLFLISMLYLGLGYAGIIGINILNALYIILAVIIVFALGTLIIAPGLNKDPEKFAIRFLLLTTVQMLTAFLLIGIIIFQKIPDFKTIGFQFITIFCVMLFLQSFLLIRINNKK